MQKLFRFAVIAFVVLLPSYLLRFKIGPLPTTVLEVVFGLIFLIWLIKYSREDWPILVETIKTHKFIFICVGLVFVASVSSIFISDMPIPSLGEWRAYFLEPIVFFLIMVGRRKEIKSVDLIWGLALSTLSISIYCIIQEFTGWGIATPEWTALATRRTTAFFSSPNAVGLYLAPIAILLLSVVTSLRAEGNTKWNKVLSAILVLSLIAVTFTKSRGAWIALTVSFVVFLFLIGYKKIVISAVVSVVVIGLLIFAVHPIKIDKSSQNRFVLWSYTSEFLTKSPKNFIFGTGIRQFFRKVQKPYYNVKQMERLIYPHNIFLNFWTEIGLVGMFAIIGILGYGFYLANKIRKSDIIIGAGLFCMLLALVIHGLVDVPYFKNDLSFLFWIFILVILFQHENLGQSKATGV